MPNATHNSKRRSNSLTRGPSRHSPGRPKRHPPWSREERTRNVGRKGEPLNPARGREKGKARIEIAAGGIVWKNSPRGPLVAFILDPFGKWTFAKGHVRRARGESPARAALRETEEEMGLSSLRVQEKLGTTSIWFRDRFEHPGALVHKFITYYLMQAPQGARGRPQKRELIKGIEWIRVDEAMARTSYANTRPVLSRAIRIIRRRGKP